MGSTTARRSDRRNVITVNAIEVIGRQHLTFMSLVNFTVLTAVIDRSDRSQYVLEQRQYRLQATTAAKGLRVTCLRSRH